MADIETELQLLVSRSVTLDVNGAGTISAVGPIPAGERWEITATQTTGASDQVPVLSIFRTGRTQSVEGTANGNLDNSDTVFKLATGESLTYQYTGGSPGVVMSITLSGSRFLRGKRAY